MPTMKTGLDGWIPDVPAGDQQIGGENLTDAIHQGVARFAVIHLATLVGITFQQMVEAAVPLADVIVRLGQAKMQPALLPRQKRGGVWQHPFQGVEDWVVVLYFDEANQL